MPGPSDAVDRLVEENPGVSSKVLINEALERGINSSADNKRGVLRTAVRRRLRNGDLVEDQGGGLWPKDHPRGKEVAAQQQEDDENEDLPF